MILPLITIEMPFFAFVLHLGHFVFKSDISVFAQSIIKNQVSFF